MKRLFFRALSALLIFTLALSLAACSATETSATPAPTATPTPTPTPTISIEVVKPTPTPTPSPTPEPVNYSITTGLPYKGVYQPVAVMIDNHADARPQYGLQSADVVYECIAEGGITRFLAIFNDNILTKIGPVRSARIYFIDLAHEWDCIYAHVGGTNAEGHPANIYTKLKKEPIKIRIDGDGKYITRQGPKSAPHNAFLNAEKARELYNYEPKPHPLPFTDDAPEGEAASEISIPYGGSAATAKYEYDSANGVYLRSTGGKVHKDAHTGKQISVKNLIVQYVKFTSFGDVTNNAAVVGKGNALYFMGGKVIKGTWQKKDTYSQTKFYDENGEEIKFLRGNTWIHISPDYKEITYK